MADIYHLDLAFFPALPFDEPLILIAAAALIIAGIISVIRFALKSSRKEKQDKDDKDE